MSIVKQWFCLLKYRISSLFEYPLDILLGVIGTVLWHMPNFVLLVVIFDSIVQLNYPRGYLILLYGLSVFGDGIQHTFAEAFWQFGNTFIKTANFDGVLVKPASNFVQVMTSRFDIDGLGGVIWGIFCCFYGFGLLDELTISNIFKIFISMLCSACFFLGINVITSATAFVFFDNFYFTHTIFQLHTFARLPKQIYPRVFGMCLTFFVPVFAATYYPANFILNSSLNLLFFLILGIIFVVISVGVWNICTRLYKSSGS